MQAPSSGKLTVVSFSTANNSPNKVLIATGTTAKPTTNNGQTCNGGGTCPFATAGQTFTLQDIEGVSGLSPKTYYSVGLASPVTVSLGQWVFVGMMLSTASAIDYLGVCYTGVVPACHTVPDQGNVMDAAINFQTTTPTVGNSFNTINPSLPGQIMGATFEPAGTVGPTVTVTQCYGNCGSPAITLANTNSTHSINFNQSTTIFYEFQSNINGFILNVTTSMAKTYLNGQILNVGIYTIPNCPVGNIPFSNQCAGILATSPSGNGGFGGISNPVKGLRSNAGYQIPVFNGQWVAVAITALYSGLDVNDTNTNVAAFQVGGGVGGMPSVLNQAVSFNAAFKMGLWAWIIGNVVSGAGASSPPAPACPGLFDCILPQFAASFCFSPTINCVNAGGIAIAVILGAVSTLFLAWGSDSLHPGLRIPIGEIFLALLLAWVFILSGLGIIFAWVPIFFFLLISVFVGRKGGYL